MSRHPSFWPFSCVIALATLTAGCALMFEYPENRAEQGPARCADGLDNDHDGRADCHDSECAAFCREDTEERCADELDNDFDGDTDCRDTQCAEYCREDSTERCHDGEDNDADDERDCEDSECSEFCQEDTAATCHDGEDNDQNGKKDCRDEKCGEHCPEGDASSCADERDNDFDGRVDCDDVDCEGYCPEVTPGECSDELDNDGDGLTDAADPRCWLHTPPQVVRCAETSGVEIVENFDAGPQWDSGVEWARYGTSNPGEGAPSVVQAAGRSKADPRGDNLVAFRLNTTNSNTLDTNLGVLVKQSAFAGSWRDFSLTFGAGVPLGSLLRVAIVPNELVPTTAPPVPGAESALVALTLDAFSPTPTLALDIEGLHFAEPMPLTRLPCNGDAFCQTELGQVSLVLDEDGFHAKLVRSNGDEVNLAAPSPSSSSLPVSRLVFWGGATDQNRTVMLDDVHLEIKSELPCGFSVPQIPSSSCDFVEELDGFGRGVSVARGVDEEYCALVSARRRPEAGEEAVETITAWQSIDGERWEAASTPDAPPLELPNGATLVGTGIAGDADGWEAAVLYRDDDGVRLGFASGMRCGKLGELTRGPALFDDAEGPSFVRGAGRRDVYFTRPPTDQTHHTLWRLAFGDDAEVDPEPELLTELPSVARSPVSVSRVGETDLVLAYPTTPGFGPPGAGFLVGDDIGRSWENVGSGPTLELRENPGGRIAFDDGGAHATSLAWDAEGGFLLYSGSSQAGGSDSTGAFESDSTLAVGTARMAPAGAELPDASAAPEGHCGDATCDAHESCSSCAADCACPGLELLRSVFTPDNPWEVASTATRPAISQYLSLDGTALNWSSGPPTWSALPLYLPLNGDFELAFDVMAAFIDPPFAPCEIYVGLGTPPVLSVDGSAVTSPPSGVFARLSYSDGCSGKYALSPFVQAPTADFTPAEPAATDCSAADLLATGSRRHVVLQREGNRVSVSMPRADGCGDVLVSERYTGTLGELPVLLIGHGGGAFGNCNGSEDRAHSGAGAISNLHLRLSDDPYYCPAGEELCDDGWGEPSCVELSSSTEHCGACFNPCAENQDCHAGSCSCSEQDGILECDSTCVDSMNSADHCGDCGVACSTWCAGGECGALSGDCASPPELPAAGGAFFLDFDEVPAVASALCGRSVFSRVIFAWIAPLSGVATVEVEPNDSEVKTLLGVTEEPSCENWTPCNDDAPELGAGSRIEFPVVAGATYRIGVGLVELDGANPSLAELRLAVKR